MFAKAQTTSSALLVMGAATAITGYLRELSIAGSFGAGEVTDAYFFVLMAVQVIHDLIVAAPLSAVIVPILAGESGSPPADRNFVSALVWIVIAGSATLAAILLVSLPMLIGVLAPQMPDPTKVLAMTFGNVLVWLLPVNAAVTLMSFVLVSRRHFVFAVLPGLVSNLAFAAILAASSASPNIRALLTACFAGPVIVAIAMAVRLIRMNLLGTAVPVSWPTLKRAWTLAHPNLLSFGIGSSIGLLMLTHLLVRGVAAGQGEGGIAALSYAFRLYEVPLSLIVFPTATIAFPLLAEARRSGTEAFARFSRSLLAWGLIVLFPVALVAWIGADAIVGILLYRGAFGDEARTMTADALRGFAPAILFEAVIVVLFKAFYAMHRPRIPVLVSALTLAALSAMLMLANSSIFALAIALSAAFMFSAVLLVALLAWQIGASALPGRLMLRRWLLAAGTMAAFALMLASKDMGDAMLAAVSFAALVIYGAAVAVLLPDYVKNARDAIAR